MQCELTWSPHCVREHGPFTQVRRATGKSDCLQRFSKCFRRPRFIDSHVTVQAIVGLFNELDATGPLPLPKSEF
eukprot:1377767-Rhodomonas_salina.1